MRMRGVYADESRACGCGCMHADARHVQVKSSQVMQGMMQSMMQGACMQMQSAYPLIGPIRRTLILACVAKCCFGLKKPLYSRTLLNCLVASNTAMSSITTSASENEFLFSIMSTYSTCLTHDTQTGWFLSGMRCS